MCNTLHTHPPIPRTTSTHPHLPTASQPAITTGRSAPRNFDRQGFCPLPYIWLRDVFSLCLVFLLSPAGVFKTAAAPPGRFSVAGRPAGCVCVCDVKRVVHCVRPCVLSSPHATSHALHVLQARYTRLNIWVFSQGPTQQRRLVAQRLHYHASRLVGLVERLTGHTLVKLRRRCTSVQVG